MNIIRFHRLALYFVVLTLTVLLFGCLVPEGGYYAGGDIGVSYYEPPVVVYGSWGPDYHVAPYRDGEHRPTYGGGHEPARAYRPAPVSHSIPSIPSKSRSGGSRSREEQPRERR